MSSCVKLDRLIKALQIQVGIGPRSATRIAYNLLDHRRKEACELAQIITEAMQSIRLCALCQNYCDEQYCAICANPKRYENRTICIVESPSDVEAIEQSHHYSGRYFVLHGHLSPIDGVGVNELGLPLLDSILAKGEIDEVILATNPTVEGDATASFIAALAQKHQIKKVSRIASGVPLGGVIDSIDEKTLASSLTNRRPFV